MLAWLARGAAIYVCGSLQGMASGVDAALRQIAGEAAMRELMRQPAATGAMFIELGSSVAWLANRPTSISEVPWRELP